MLMTYRDNGRNVRNAFAEGQSVGHRTVLMNVTGAPGTEPSTV